MTWTELHGPDPVTEKENDSHPVDVDNPEPTTEAQDAD